MNRLLELARHHATGLLLVLACGACEDPVLEQKADSLGPDPGPYEEGPLHRAGFPCNWCHDEHGGREPHFDLAGTVYERRDSAQGLGGVQVHLFDQSGHQQTLISNQAGNFFFVKGDLALDFPLWVKLEYQGEVTAMQTPILRERSCAACHLEPASSSTVGRIFLREDP